MHRVYISIEEFAVRANISRQRAYQMLDKKLKPYCKAIGNRKFIDSSALDNFTSQNLCQVIDRKNENRVDNFTNNTLRTLHGRKLLGGIVDRSLGRDENIELVISSLEKQIETKDFQIKEKDKQIKSKDNQIFELQNIIKSMQKQLKNILNLRLKK